MQSRRSNKRGARRIRQGSGGRSQRAGPPEFMATISTGHKFRFASLEGNVALPVTGAMMLNLMTMATTTTNQFRVLAAIKIKRISVWGQPPALGADATQAAVEWTGVHAPSAYHSDSSMGVRPAFVSTRPPPESSCAWWITSGSADEGTQICKITAPDGGIIDVDCSLRFIDNEAAVAGQAGTGAAATVGTIYYNYLDGFTSLKYKPVGVTVLP